MVHLVVAHLVAWAHLVVAVITTSSPATSSIILALARGLGAVAAALVRLHAAADGLGRNTGADFNVRLFDGEACVNGPAAASAKGSRKHPLSVGVRKLVDGNDTNAR